MPETTPSHRGPSWSAYAALWAAILIWGSAFPAIRYGLRGYSPGELAVVRFVIASGVALLLAITLRVQRPRRADLPWLSLLGLLGFTAYHLGLNYGEVRIGAAAAGALVAMVPIFGILVARIALKERLTIRGVAAILMGLVGAILISFGEGGALRFEWSTALVLGAAACEAVFFVLQKPLLARYSALALTTWTMVLGTLFMLPFGLDAWNAVRTAPIGSTLAAAYLGIFSSVLAYGLWAHALSRIPTQQVFGAAYLLPVVAAVVAIPWLGEWPSLQTCLGGLLGLAGVALATRGAPSRRGSKDAAPQSPGTVPE